MERRTVGQSGTKRGVGPGTVLKRVLVGRRAPTWQMEHTLLPKVLALPIFTADALSSVAYCVESSMVVLIAGGVGALHYVIGIQIAVAALMAIVVASYRQVVRAYRTSGGAYVVARENLGVLPSLVAAGSLLVDYVLTVAVSVASGVLAITSAVPSLHPFRLEITIFFILVIPVLLDRVRGRDLERAVERRRRVRHGRRPEALGIGQARADERSGAACVRVVGGPGGDGDNRREGARVRIPVPVDEAGHLGGRTSLRS